MKLGRSCWAGADKPQTAVTFTETQEGEKTSELTLNVYTHRQSYKGKERETGHLSALLK